MPQPTADWSTADAGGIQSCVLDRQHRHRLRRSARPPDHSLISAWPIDWRALLGQWLRSSAARPRWRQWLKIAGNERYTTAVDLQLALLETGWIELEEHRERDQWRPHSARWIADDDLREALGLDRHDSRANMRKALLAQRPLDERLHALHASLAGMPTAGLSRRAELLAALDRWAMEQRSGSRQQFALRARADTKRISSSEWHWLAAHVDLDDLGISGHAPSLWLRAPLVLHQAQRSLDLRLVPDLIGLSTRTLASLDAIEGDIGYWLLVENRGSFEQVAAAAGHRCGVLWLPGFAPGWWLRSVERLLRWLPRPAWIAADPDPAGIDIALRAAGPWQAQGLTWQPWAMDEQVLAALPHHKPLNDFDRARLAALVGIELPPELRRLAQAMQQLNRKGEQEGIDLPAQCPSAPPRAWP